MIETKVIASQKGGVGKTATTANLGFGLTREGKSVLLVDADPQGSLTKSLGYDETSGGRSRRNYPCKGYIPFRQKLH